MSVQADAGQLDKRSAAEVNPMKKFLSLVLVLSMVLSVVAIADADEKLVIKLETSFISVDIDTDEAGDTIVQYYDCYIDMLYEGNEVIPIVDEYTGIIMLVDINFSTIIAYWD